MVDLAGADAPIGQSIARRPGLVHLVRLCSRYLTGIIQAEEGRWILWLPVLLGMGIGFYFALPVEPSLWVGLATLIVTGGAIPLARAGLRPVFVTILIILTGFTAAQLRTASVAAPKIEGKHGPAWVEGTIIHVDRGPTATGGRLLIKPSSISYLSSENLPERIRVTVRKGLEALQPGDRVNLRAILLAPPEPAVPGGFDFARQAWFTQLGSVGFTLGAPSFLEASAQQSVVAKAKHWVAQLRLSYAGHIAEHVDGAPGAVVAALLTGERRAIPEDVLNAFRDSGIAHLLAISGLHMGLFTGALFWLVRLLLAMCGTLALRYPIKKWAAGAAFAGATAYLLLSGAAISTQRAYIMTAVMLFAVIVDRPAITMRNVALAALVTLLWRPENLLHVGFQMSFAAVISLVAWFESFRGKVISARGADATQLQRLWRVGSLYVYGLITTSLISGLATAPFAAYHFNRIAAFNLIADIGSMPIMVAAVMPAALVAILAAPFGLDSLPLQFMGASVAVIIAIGREVSSWPGAVLLLPAVPPASLVLVALGGLWLCLWRTTWRYCGLALATAGLIIALTSASPDVLIERDGKNVALRNGAGDLVLLSSRAGRYSAETWLRRDGDSRLLKEAASLPPSVTCDHLGCAYYEAGRPVIAYARDGRAIADDCRNADIVIASVPIRGACPSAKVVVDRFDLWRHGAHTLWFRADGTIDVLTSAASRGSRPWVQLRD